MKKFTFQKALAFALIIAAICVFFLASCNAFKVTKHELRDSVVIKIQDSIRIKNIVHRKDSTVIKDTLVRVKYDRAQYAFDAYDTKDTAIKSGRATLRKSVNNGVITVQADCDSFDILITDMRLVIQQKDQENEYLNSQISELKQSKQETTIKEPKKGFFARLFNGARNILAIVGLIWLAVLIIRLFIKR